MIIDFYYDPILGLTKQVIKPSPIVFVKNNYKSEKVKVIGFNNRFKNFIKNK